MKIGLNATCFNDRPSGARQRFVGIYGELMKRLPDTEFVVYEPADCRVAAWFNGAPNVSARRTPLPSEGRAGKYIRGLGFWPSALASENFDFFEGFNLPLVSAPTGRTLLTIHDIREIYPDSGSDVKRALYKAVLAKSIKAADHVVTVSASVQNELLEFYPQTQSSVIHNGIDIEKFETISEAELLAVQQGFDLPENFLLAVGHFEKRKNYLNLIAAIALMRDRTMTAQLILIGNDAGELGLVNEKIQSLHLQHQVRIFNGLTDAQVRCFYKLCMLFVFPSAYEGFGIPILEAMAARRPMVLSDIPVFREITENEVCYFPHDDPVAIASAIEDVLGSSGECDRLIAYGRRRVGDFSFQKISSDLANLYSSLPWDVGERRR